MNMDARLKKYEEMWTSELAKYGLVELRNGGSFFFDLEAGGPVIIDEDPGVLAALKERMRDAGVRRLTEEDVAPK
jgi:hypothetical protein